MSKYWFIGIILVVAAFFSLVLLSLEVFFIALTSAFVFTYLVVAWCSERILLAKAGAEALESAEFVTTWNDFWKESPDLIVRVSHHKPKVYITPDTTRYFVVFRSRFSKGSFLISQGLFKSYTEQQLKTTMRTGFIELRKKRTRLLTENLAFASFFISKQSVFYGSLLNTPAEPKFYHDRVESGWGVFEGILIFPFFQYFWGTAIANSPTVESKIPLSSISGSHRWLYPADILPISTRL